MKLTHTLGALLLCSAAVLAQPVEAAGWRLVAEQGARHFVTVDAALEANPAVYREAAASLCGAGKACIVMFWSDPQLAAGRMPLTAAQRDGLIAQFNRNPASGHEELLLRCRLAVAPRCLK